jgi:hypothetical protein
VTHGALAVGLAGLLDGQVHGGAGSRLKRRREQAVGQPKCDRNAGAHFPALGMLRGRVVRGPIFYFNFTMLSACSANPEPVGASVATTGGVSSGGAASSQAGMPVVGASRGRRAIPSRASRAL